MSTITLNSIKNKLQEDLPNFTFVQHNQENVIQVGRDGLRYILDVSIIKSNIDESMLDSIVSDMKSNILNAWNKA